MRTRTLATFGTALVVLTIGAAPFLTSAADHLDAPALGGATAGGQIDPHSEHGDRDINDVYVFDAPDASDRTAIAVTVNPAINLFGGNFGTNVRYVVNLDTTGDNVQDIAYVTTFGDENADGDQHFVVRKYIGSRAVSLTGGKPVVQGFSNSTSKAVNDADEWVWAGVRSDPFFFDLTGFIGTTTFLTTGTAVGGDALGVDPSDFFANLNTNAIVFALRDADLPDTIGVWATTSWFDGTTWQKADQMGRPAINTVFNPTADKDAFNATAPSQQATAFGGKFRSNVIAGLQFFSGLDSEGAYTADQAGFLASVLIPDVLVYSRSNPLGLPAPLNGRALADDVIDVELIVTTGGDPLNLFGPDMSLTGIGPDRDASGAVNGDGVGPHSDYLSVFPYLGIPHD